MSRASRTRPRISYAIARLQQLVLTGVSECVAPSGLTALQFTTLSVLSRHGAPLSNSQLARRSFMTPQSMHEVIHRLEQDGLIERNAHPSHGRKLPASLTVKGRRVLATCDEAIADFEAHMLHSFAEVDRDKFLRMITTAVRNLGGGFDDVEIAPSGSRSAPHAQLAAAARAKAKPIGLARRARQARAIASAGSLRHNKPDR
jgi:DNA-binding MarR family transcriptional regulator